eukprot:39966-Amphidinium_carterae.1
MSQPSLAGTHRLEQNCPHKCITSRGWIHTIHRFKQSRKSGNGISEDFCIPAQMDAMRGCSMVERSWGSARFDGSKGPQRFTQALSLTTVSEQQKTKSTDPADNYHYGYTYATPSYARLGQ